MPELLPGTIQETQDQSDSALEPGYLVICWNDPVNYMGYVTHVFQTVFGWPRQKAEFHMLQVHEQGPTYADVTEGNNQAWERLRYDWSNPRRVVMTTIDSNLWGGASGHTYTLSPNPDGTTDVDVVIVRDGKNLKGRLLGLFLGIAGKGQLEKWFAKTLKAIEARNYKVSMAAMA